MNKFMNDIIIDMMLPDDLKPLYKPPPKIPCEPAGTGLNKKVYFVTSERELRKHRFVWKPYM
jgi:hypothetical protein